MKGITIIFMLQVILCYSQSDVPLTLRAQFNGAYGYTIIGNTHNANDNWFQNPPPPCQMLTQSSATLNLLPNQIIMSAYLYWSGIGNGTQNSTIQLNGTNYTALETVLGYPENNLTLDYFGSYIDVTNQVANIGNGIYTFSNFNLNSIIANYCTSAIYYSGWSLLIIYNQTNLPNQQINIYDGLNAVSEYFNNGSTPLVINNMNVINNQNAKISYVAYNGSPNLFFNESISFNSNLLNNNLNPPNNPFNGSNSFNNSNTNWNQDIDTFDISSFVNVGDTQANIIFKSFFYRFIQTLVTSICSELPDATVALNTVSGQNVCNNRNLQVNYTVQNTNSNGNLPANIPVSFYADNVFLSTVFTPTPIAIGGVLPLQTTVNIPMSVSNTFNLRVLVDNAVSVTSTVAESNEGNNESSQPITLIGGSAVPVFSAINPFCAGAVAPILPAISNNGIAGSWSPAVVNNQNSGSYVFMPNAGVCAATATVNVVVNAAVAPTFSIGSSFCRGVSVSVLPTVSNNDIAGSWSPSVIDNQNSANYTFTPSANQCAATFVLPVTINAIVAPTFSIPTSYCAGATAPVLPTTSNNGIAGNWSPAVISNQISGDYVFTPNTGVCASSTTLNVIINPIVTPSFALPNSICQNDVAPILPATSTNNISGTWLPAVVSNQNSGSYVFTPAASGQCANGFVYNLTVEPQTPKKQEVFLCSNNNPTNGVLPVLLDSGLLTADYGFEWSLNNTILPNQSPTILVNVAGIYNLVAMPSNGECPLVFVFEVKSFLPIVATVTISEDFALDPSISVTASGGSGMYAYSFNNLPFQNSKVFTTSNGGDVLVTVRDNTDCTEFSTTVQVWQYPRFFSPNGDSFNDTWSISSRKKINIDIFNGFGKLLKKLKNNEHWNGTFDGAALLADDYWFVITYDQNKIFKGHFSLKR